MRAAARVRSGLLGEVDDLLRHGPLGLADDLKLHLHGAQNFPSLPGDGVTFCGLKLTVLDRLEGVPERVLQIDRAQFL